MEAKRILVPGVERPLTPALSLEDEGEEAEGPLTLTLSPEDGGEGTAVIPRSPRRGIPDSLAEVSLIVS
jgi:hypothetical protein